MYGPALNEIYGKEVLVIRQGDSSKVVIDRKYLKRSIIDPDFEKLKGYENRSMPVPDISKKEVKILVDYLMELPEE